MFGDLFSEMAALLLVAVGLGAVGALLRQPLIVSFIAVGIVVGPSVLGWVSANDQVDLLAKLGIALLLFAVGLKLDLNIIRRMGMVALATGLGQVLFTSVVGYLIAIALGMAPVAALYVAVALTFSSTIIIVKLLSDKREVDTLHGQIALGFLIVQDLVVVLAMIGLNALAGAGDGQAIANAFGVLIRGLAWVAVVAFVARYLFPRLLPLLARSQELLVLFGIAWAAALAALGTMLGFSKEVGAFIAGVSLASTPYRDLLVSRLVSLRDFLLLFFFIDLGARLDLGLLGSQLFESLVFSLFVLVGNPLIVMVIMGLLGYRKRTGFLAGLTVAQISEFSLILGALGVSLGHIAPETMGLITLVGLITISASTYMILFSHRLYDLLAPWLGAFERRHPAREQAMGLTHENRATEFIVFGGGRYGFGLAQALRERGRTVRVVDSNPDLVRRTREDPYPISFGDAEDVEFVESLAQERAQWVVCTIRDERVGRALVAHLRNAGFAGGIAVAAAGERLWAAGADLVLEPFSDAAREAADRLLVAAPGDPAVGRTGAPGAIRMEGRSSG